MPLTLRNERLEDKRSFWCPNGHDQHYTENEVDRLKKQRTELERKLASAREDEMAAWHIAEERRKEAAAERKAHGTTKMQLTKTRKRAAATVCPVESCHRSIGTTQMQRHIKSKHPGYTPEEA